MKTIKVICKEQINGDIVWSFYDDDKLIVRRDGHDAQGTSSNMSWTVQDTKDAYKADMDFFYPEGYTLEHQIVTYVDKNKIPTPKEKAVLLYSNFHPYTPAEEKYEHECTVNAAKACVDEIIDLLNKEYMSTQYWEEVKKELDVILNNKE